MEKKEIVYETVNVHGSVYKFVEKESNVVVYVNGELWGVPQGQRFIKALLRDIRKLKSEEEA